MVVSAGGWGQGMRGLLGGRRVSGESGVLADRRQGVLDCLMDRDFGLLIDSAVLVICCAQEGAEKASGAGVRSAWGGFGRLAPVLAERERRVSLGLV